MGKGAGPCGVCCLGCVAMLFVSGTGCNGPSTPPTTGQDATESPVTIVVDDVHGFPERHRERHKVFLKQLGSRGRTVRMLGRPIDETSLEDCGLFVVVMPGKRYTDEELKHVQTFLEGGGGLLVLGGDGGLDKLPLGIRLLSSKDGVYGPNWFPRLNDMIDHPITRGVFDVTVDTGRALEVEPPAVVLGRSGDDTWLEPLGSGTRKPSPEKPRGPFAVVAVAEVGKGRVFYAGSHSLFMDSHVGATHRGNLRLMRHCIRWLIESHGAAAP